jgi:uncharacterized damage-inducible protein DinB
METLHRYLGTQREHVLGIVEGLDDEALRRPVLPSGWSVIAMISHLTEDVERFWFHAVAGGDAGAVNWSADAWRVPPDVTGAAVLAAYRRAIEESDAVIATLSPKQQPAWWPDDLFGTWRLENIRDLMLHVITETGSHTGHLDAARELIDGRQWLVLDASGVPTDDAVAVDHR